MPGYEVGGKTGTAEKSVHGSYAKKALFSSFVGVFPMSDPKFLVLVSLDEPKGLPETGGYATGGMVSALHAGGGGRLVAVVCVDQHGNTLLACGRCRQLLWENGGSDLLVETVSGIKTMTEVLPDAFGPDDLVTRA